LILPKNSVALSAFNKAGVSKEIKLSDY